MKCLVNKDSIDWRYSVFLTLLWGNLKGKEKKSSYQNNEGNRSNETPDKIVIYMEPATIMEEREWKVNDCTSIAIQ